MPSPFARTKLPFLLAILYSVPLLMISILCASLALDKPQVAIWRTHIKYPGVTVLKKAAEQGVYIATQYTSTSNATEWRIWGWAIVPPLVVLGIGVLCSFVRYGAYLVSLAAIVVTIGVTHRLGTWVGHHTQRYPYGYDNIPDNTNKPGLQSTYDTGQWEHSARHTVLSIRQWLLVGALAALILMALSEVRRRRGSADRPRLDAVPAGMAPSLAPPGPVVPPAGGVPPQ
jgi:hypothetical protein